MSADDRRNEKNTPLAPDPDREGTGPSARPEELDNSGNLAVLPDEPAKEDETAESEAPGT